MRKSIALSTAALLSCTLLQAADVKVDGKDAGDVELQLKAMHILHDKNNGFAPNSGSGYLVKLKYDTPDILTDGLKIGVGMYANGDTGYTAWASPGKYKPAKGMFVDYEGQSKALMGEAYLAYKNDSFHAKVGRQILNTPLTTIKWSLMPSFYEAAVAGTKAGDLSITAAHVSKMSFGSRAMTDWGLIGEGTGTAGVATALSYSGPNNTSPAGAIDQAKFYNMGVAALGSDGINAAGTGDNTTDGITALGLGYKAMKNLDVNLWAYHAYDIANEYYVDANYAIPVADGIKTTISAQYLKQVDTGKELAGQVNFDLYGAKVALGNKKMGAFAAYNQSSSGDQFVNAFGADPAYTSSIFSRNAYRKDVKAYKIGAHYMIMKGMKFMANYAQYGQSKTTFKNNGTTFASDNAYEADFVLVYKPTKAWMFKIFDAWRVSEYNSSDNKRQHHVRAVASYTF